DDPGLRTRNSASRTCASSRSPTLAGSHPPPPAAYTAGPALPPAPQPTAQPWALLIWLLYHNQAPIITSQDVGPLRMCRTPVSAGHIRNARDAGRGANGPEWEV